MPTQALAYFITWTCRGTWLHGNDRFSVDRHRRDGRNELATPSVRRQSGNIQTLAHVPVLLSPDDRRVVENAIRDDCAHRCWSLCACNARSNHVHVVVAAAGETPERVMQRLKSWATRRLREHDPEQFSGGVWTRHGSTRYLWNEHELTSAVHYVKDGQDAPYRWERPPANRD